MPTQTKTFTLPATRTSRGGVKGAITEGLVASIETVAEVALIAKDVAELIRGELQSAKLGQKLDWVGELEADFGLAKANADRMRSDILGSI